MPSLTDECRAYIKDHKNVDECEAVTEFANVFEKVPPPFFTGTSFLVGEIELGVSVLAAKVRALKEGNRHCAAVTQKLSAEEISKIAGQIKMMADTLSRVSIAHINRRSTVKS